MDDKYQYMSVITQDMAKYKLPKRLEDFHKGNFGKLFCICGSREMPGSAWFVVSSAIKCGVGGVKSCVVPSIYEIISQKVPETTFCLSKEDDAGFMTEDSIEMILNEMKKCSAAVIGCGLGWRKSIKSLVYEIIRNTSIPLVIDADGINVISENIDILKEARCEIILTPHPKEMARLVNVGLESVDKIKHAQRIASKYKITVLLKGHRTVILDKEGNIFLNTTGNVGMAKGGSGDVLSGMIGSFLAQGISPIDATICGAFIHGFAGDRCREKLSSVSMIPSDIVNELSNLFLEFGF